MNKWITKKEHHVHMNMRQIQHRGRGLIPAEIYVKNELKSRTKYKWTTQAVWGWRLFDFWNAEIGCAIEVDGPEHSKEKDRSIDEFHFKRSAIIVLRIKNFSEQDLQNAVIEIQSMDTWLDRRKSITKPPETITASRGQC